VPVTRPCRARSSSSSSSRLSTLSKRRRGFELFCRVVVSVSTHGDRHSVRRSGLSTTNWLGASPAVVLDRSSSNSAVSVLNNEPRRWPLATCRRNRPPNEQVVCRGHDPTVVNVVKVSSVPVETCTTRPTVVSVSTVLKRVGLARGQVRNKEAPVRLVDQRSDGVAGRPDRTRHRSRIIERQFDQRPMEDSLARSNFLPTLLRSGRQYTNG